MPEKYPHPLGPLLSLLLPFLLLQASVAETLTPEQQLKTLASPPLIAINTTILSPNRTFELGFFSVDGGSAWYLGIWYASIPIRTYVWVANRLSPVRAAPPSGFLTTAGHLAVLDSSGYVQWETDNAVPAAAVQLHDTGNLALLSVGGGGDIAWQSFDFPADTWLPEMAVRGAMSITSWRSPTDPSPGEFSLRLRPPNFGEFELVFNGSVSYWWTGNWTGSRFAGVPEMTVPYIYNFRFSNPFTPDAAFDYSQSPQEESGLRLLLSRFAVDSSGQLMQYTWSPQAASWNIFWSRPEIPCRVYGRCGRLGFCAGGGLRPCSCPAGLHPVNPAGWNSGDFSGGCFHDAICPVVGVDAEIVFKEIGPIQFDDAVDSTFIGVSRRYCEDSCRKNCSCFGLTYNSESRTCTNLYGSAYNLRNSTSSPIMFIKNTPGIGSSNRKRMIKWKVGLLIGIISALVSNLAIAAALGLILLRRHRRQKRMAEYGGLKVFTYKELSSATRGFSEKLGQGGFGVVFRGTLPDSTPVAVKRLERPGGGGDREFRAEVRTIGNVQHVNLVRLRGFCSEDPQRLLVYDYMPNGPLSAYLGRSSNPPPLSWPARFRIAVGTARGIAYLHEECRDCIIHCDIKPENILLDLDFIPRVSDFGLAKLVGRDLSRVLATTRGTRGYVAPEWISGVAITAKADVYSYGMTLMEIIGGRRNVEAPQEGEEEWFFPAWAARRIVEGDLGSVVEEAEGFDRREAERAGRVAVWCIQDEEGARPAMGTVVKMLEGTVEVASPPLPKMLQAIVAGDSFRQWGIGSETPCGVVSAGEIRVENGTGMAAYYGFDSPPVSYRPFGENTAAD
ncbi:G-type lectin S-receptor-like serine/threonine-protein kinase SD2-2 [Platanthera zijinensis]|uniref:Receptor-like serine/threonine-protein kinase n=1 Tax=Platanthera zijinensis TaxID=2320716 RepID=A0AAP0BZW9_9ASPA